MVNRPLILWGVFLLFAGMHATAQLPEACKPPASATHAPPGTPPAKVDDAVGAWFAEKGNLRCAAAAFQLALKLEPRSAEAHFDLGLVRQRQHQSAAAAGEFRQALRYDPALTQAHCALGSVLSAPAEAEAEFRKALENDPSLICALDGLAQVLLTGGRYDAALSYWRQAIQLQPDDPDLQVSLATATYKAARERHDAGLTEVDGMRVADAVRLLTELIKSHPDLTAAHYTLGNIYANEHRFREAADEYREVVKQDPTNMDALSAEIEALLDVDAYTDALEPAKNYAAKKPNDPSAHIMLGMTLRGLGDYAKAEPELELGATKKPDDFEAQYQLGSVLAHLGRPQEALPRLKKAVALNSGDKSAQFQLAAVLRQLGEKDEAAKVLAQFQKATDTEFQISQLTPQGIQANDLLQAGKPAEAAQIYRHMLEEDPMSAWTAYNLGLALEATHDYKGAEQAFHQGIDIDPKLAKIQAELGKLELASGDLESAQKWLQSAVDLDPELVGARGNLAMVRARQGDMASAVKLLRQAIEDDPTYKEGHLNLGLILAQQGDIQGAEQELDKAVALSPEDAATLSTVGKAKVQMGKSSEGIALLQKVVKLAPDLAAAHLDLAIALADSYDLPGALAETDEAVRLAPQSGVVHFNRGRVLFDMGRSSEAQPELETATRLVPQMAEPKYFLALIDKEAGNLPEATHLLEETVKLDPHDLMALYLLGQCLEQQHESAKAIAVWRQAIALNPKFSQALFGLARALRSTDPAESEQFMARYTALQKEQQILDEANTLANNGVVSASAHDWPEAIRQLKAALAECKDCAAKADLHKKLGLIDCQAGDLDGGEKELLEASAIKPADPEIKRALDLIARARIQHPKSTALKVN